MAPRFATSSPSRMARSTERRTKAWLCSLVLNPPTPRTVASTSLMMVSRPPTSSTKLVGAEPVDRKSQPDLSVRNAQAERGIRATGMVMLALWWLTK